MGHKRFDDIESVNRFERELASFDVWYNPKLDITSEGLYCLWYDRLDYEKKLEKEYCEVYGVEY